jgi:hypothetical protein
VVGGASGPKRAVCICVCAATTYYNYCRVSWQKQLIEEKGPISASCQRLTHVTAYVRMTQPISAVGYVQKGSKHAGRGGGRASSLAFLGAYTCPVVTRWAGAETRADGRGQRWREHYYLRTHHHQSNRIYSPQPTKCEMCRKSTRIRQNSTFVKMKESDSRKRWYATDSVDFVATSPVSAPRVTRCTSFCHKWSR